MGCLFLLLVPSQPLPKKNLFLAPKSSAQLTELEEDTVKFILILHKMNKEVVALWMEFTATDLGPGNPESLIRRADFVKRLWAIPRQINNPYLENAPRLKAGIPEYYHHIQHLVISGIYGILRNLNGLSPDKRHPEDDFFMALANCALLRYLQNFRSFALIVQKGELLNFGSYFSDVGKFEFVNLEKLQSKPDVVPLPPELFSEIDSMIQPLPKRTVEELCAEIDSRRARSVNCSL